jgi:hypothetical protein
LGSAIACALALSLATPARAQTASGEPPPWHPQSTEQHEEVEVHFDANRAGVAFMLPPPQAAGSPPPAIAYDYVCTVPCKAHLFTGTRHLALSLEGEPPLDVDIPVGVSTPTTLKANYESRATLRGAGLGILVGGVVLGTLLGFVGIPLLQQNNGLGVSMIASGSAATVGSVVLGTVLLLKGDRATIEVLPQAGVSSLSGQSAVDHALGLGPSRELAFRVRF